ncbi:Os01g0138100 [Oryza sativa Japonica Group]|uniref:Os01g0138100 protein n=1 Tax=Oryza sativa subsp. japonica TaxID=39947 RepID=Q0JQU6_ORYSJ|nr:Os01g0138100 [Oryza sativa Japonica Group]|eukprot:NP_001041968.2 Os01g0138100 [Oryza sativa Japonica Group]
MEIVGASESASYSHDSSFKIQCGRRTDWNEEGGKIRRFARYAIWPTSMRIIYWRNIGPH